MINSTSSISVHGVSKHYGGVRALSEVSVDLGGGAITAMIGPNGAGKTTLFDVMTGFTKPDSGRVEVRGVDVTNKRPESIARLGVVRTFQGTRLARRLSVLDNLFLAAGGRSSNGLERCGLATPLITHNRASEILAEVGLGIRVDQRAGALSFGEQKLLSLALCLVGGHDVLLLDEPFAGVDAGVVAAMSGLLQRWRDLGKSILVIEHNISAVVEISDRILVLNGGRMFKDVKPCDLGKDDDILHGFLKG